MKQVIVYGGSFNPFHNGHAAIVEHCLALPGYDEVWIMPSAKRTDKPDLVADETRLAMLIAYKDSFTHVDRKLVITDFEMALGAPSETIRTYQALRTAYPRINFTFVFGSDSVADIYNWRGGDVLAETLDIIVVDRIGEVHPLKNPRHIRAEIPEDVAGISSTLIRSKIRAGEPISSLVPRAIALFIPRHNLYS